ncbi:MAG: flagellar motor switch protein FliM [Syntrophales bacterium]|jgi:flagellar motor switch protein FliM|nr:flagellar motor switch protein FliM [Syntrophales bacterium]
MANILSQEEVDALLRGISGGEVETEVVDKTVSEGVVSYDLTSQDRIIRGRMPTLEMMNEKFSRIFRGTMSSTLRKVVNVSAMSTDMLKFGEFMKTLPVPTSMHLFKMDPLRGSALFVFESKIIFTLVDLIFGGSGTAPYKIEGREFTPIENNLIKKIVLSALADLEVAWKSLLDIKITYLRSEINPQFAQIVPPTDVVIVINYEVELEYTTGVMSVCIPYSSLEPIREKLQAGYQSENMEVDKVWAGRFKDYMMMAGLDIAVELGKTNINGRDLLNLQKGDVIRLNQFAADPLTAFIEGVAKYRVEPGCHKGNMAGRITELIAKEA